MARITYLQLNKNFGEIREKTIEKWTTIEVKVYRTLGLLQRTGGEVSLERTKGGKGERGGIGGGLNDVENLSSTKGKA